MPSFTYQANDSTGRTLRGSLDAADRSSAIRQLTGKGLRPFQIAEAGSPAAAAADKKGGSPATAKGKAKAAQDSGPIKLSTNHVQLFAEELAELLGAGMRLEPALKLMEGRGDTSAHRRVAKRVGDLVREGHSFSAALRQSSTSFGELFCAVAAAGEAGGSLAVAMQRQSAYLSNSKEIRAKVAIALIYPSFLLVAALGVTLLFATFLIPQLTEMVQSISGGLPTGIKIMLAATEFIKSWWPALLLGIGALIMGFLAWTKSSAGKPHWHRAQLRLPFAGPVLRASFHSQFLETLASLTHGGLPLLRGMDLASSVSSNLFIRKELVRAVDLVRDGGSLSRALERTNLFPINLLEMVRIGEHTGELADALRRSADRCARELGKRLESAVAMMQPVIILLMAGLVGETMNAVRNR
jgi:type II secretory pathway component PulF